MNVALRLSIGLSVYNGGNYLAESLDALLGQSYKDFELIISDNASTDGTADICRRYQKQDSSIRYIRQPRNFGLAGNHNFVFEQARRELFKWASHDDIYARELLQRCVDALDEYPHVVLAHFWAVMIDGSGAVVKPCEYPLTTASLRTPERFRRMLFAEGGYDVYGVTRASVLRRTALHGSYPHADRTVTTEIALHGPGHQVPDWLYSRGDHPGGEERACPTVRTRCANIDPRRADRLQHQAARLYAEHIWGCIAGNRRAPLQPADRRECCRYLVHWVTSRALPRCARQAEKSASPTQPVISADTVVSGRGRGPS